MNISIFKSVAVIMLSVCGLGLYGEKINVSVSIPPQAYIVQKVGGNKVNVNTMVEDGKSPHDYSPTPRQVAGLGNSRLYFSIMMPFEQRLEQKLKGNSECKFVNMAAGIKLRESSSCDGHHAEHGHHHHNETADPHVWMSPVNLKIMAENVRQALVQVMPKDKAEFDRNYRILAAELTDLNNYIRKTLAAFKGRTVFVYHPAFGYFTDLYGLKLESIEIEGKDPTPRQIMNLISEAKKQNVKTIFVQRQFNSQSAEKIAQAIGGHVVGVNVLDYNIVGLLKKMTDEIKNDFLAEKHN
jgi:zinc transport system substrate-binding protein